MRHKVLLTKKSDLANECGLSVYKDNSVYHNLKPAFSLAEMMVVMLIMSIVLAAMAPVITTRIKADEALKAGVADKEENKGPWFWADEEAKEGDAYTEANTAIVGYKPEKSSGNFDAKLVILNPGFTGSSFTSGEVTSPTKSLMFINKLYQTASPKIMGYLDLWKQNDAYKVTHQGIVLGDFTSSVYEGYPGNLVSIGFDNAVNTKGYGNVMLGNDVKINAYSDGSTSPTEGAVAIGYKAKAVPYSVAVGYGSSTFNEGATAIGASSYAKGKYSICIGRAQAQADGSIYIGSYYFKETGHNDVAWEGQAKGKCSLVIGNASFTYYDKGISIGNEIYNWSEKSVAIGYYSTIKSGSFITSVGNSNKVFGDYCTAYGSNNIIGTDSYYGSTNDHYNYRTAIGYNNNLQGGDFEGASSVALGDSNTITGAQVIAIGYKNKGGADRSNYVTVIGSSNTATGITALAIGKECKASGNYAIALGAKNEASGDNDPIAIGFKTVASGNYAIALGANSKASAGASIAIGSDSNSSGSIYSIAMGSSSEATADYAMALGNYSKASGKYSVAIGYKAEAPNEYDFVLGTSSHNVKIPGTLTVKGVAVNSDKRLKYIKGENKSGLDKIRQIKVYDFTFKKDKNKEPRVGVIAQELQKILPDAVKKGSDGFLTIRIDDIIYTLVNAVKELDRKVSELTETLKQVQAEQKRINQRLDALERK